MKIKLENDARRAFGQRRSALSKRSASVLWLLMAPRRHETSIKCWFDIADGEPAINRHWINASWLMAASGMSSTRYGQRREKQIHFETPPRPAKRPARMSIPFYHCLYRNMIQSRRGISIGLRWKLASDTVGGV